MKHHTNGIQSHCSISRLYRGALEYDFMTRRKNIFRASLFFVLSAIMASFLSALLVPVGSNTLMLSAARGVLSGLYEQPMNTAQVIVIGASAARQAFSPVQMHNEYGITSYNCSTLKQPPIATYHLLKEALRMQGESVTTVVVEVSQFLPASISVPSAESVAVYMDSLSPVRYEYVRELADRYEGVRLEEQLVPLLRYHSSWTGLKKASFENLFAFNHAYLHGQGPSLKSNVTNGTAGKCTIEKNATITDSVDVDTETIEESVGATNTDYLKRIVDLCRKNNINVVFWKTPSSFWGDKNHDCIAYYAKLFDVPFLDMSTPSVFNECQLSYDLDFEDAKHANIIGSVKITNYLGAFLSEHYSFDRETTSDTALFTSDDTDRYAQLVEDCGLSRCDNLKGYASKLGHQRYTVFIAVKGVAAEDLSDEIRSSFEALGLEKLSVLRKNESYVGVLHSGQCAGEVIGKKGKAASLTVLYDKSTLKADAPTMQSDAAFDSSVLLRSSGSGFNSMASVQFGLGEDTVEYCEDKPGINFVVFDSNARLLVDTSSFSFYADGRRTSDLMDEQ